MKTEDHEARFPKLVDGRLYFIRRGSSIDQAYCRCGKLMIKMGWDSVCPAKQWFNFFLHTKKI